MMFTLFLCLLSWQSANCMYTEKDGRRFMKDLNHLFAKESNKMGLLDWQFECDMTDENEEKVIEQSKQFAIFEREKYNETMKYPYKTFNDSILKDQFHMYALPGISALSDEKYEKLDELGLDMESIYTKGTICDYHNPKKCNLSLEPEIAEILANSRDEKELRHVWTQWREKSGKLIRKQFAEFVNLTQEVALLNNFTDVVDMWLDGYEMDDFEEQIDQLWQKVRPLYLQLHAYVRRKLREKYGEKLISKRGPIPAHLLGNMWAQSWSNIVDLINPFPHIKPINVTKHLIQQNYTPVKIFRTVDNFFTSMNLTPVPDTFWERSVLEKIPNRDMVCHASAWDFCDGKDFRIKQCTKITEEDFQTAYHEMGHIQYFMQYKDQPFVYRDAANPGFHEAIGDVIGLSVSTQKHLHRIGLLPTITNSRDANLNYLFNIALEKVVFLPFGYSLDLWRWDVFRGNITQENYNREWWKLRTEYQGIKPPVERKEEDFDPGSKFHIATFYPYIDYFVSFIIQFQFQEALCIKAGQYDPQNPTSQPFHQCDIYESKAAGNLLGKMLQLGCSEPWPIAMEILTGQKNMDAGPLLRYFAPIYEWLKEENNRTGEYVGWESE